MSSLIDIARSGILAHRTALSTTAENLANVNTESYARRSAEMQPVSGGVMTPTSSAVLGKSVQVTDVRRAFDDLAVNRLWAAESALSAAKVRVSQGQALESVFMPNASGIGNALNDFVDGLNTLAGQPADIGLRQVAIVAGQTLAARMSDTAIALTDLHEQTLSDAHLSAQKVTFILSDLAKLNKQMSGTKNTMGVLNPIHDMRDRLLNTLSAKLQVDVTLDSTGRAMVRLGSGSGGVLLDARGANPAQVEVSVDPSGPEPFGLKVSGTEEVPFPTTSYPAGGKFKGLSNSAAAIRVAESELNALAQRLAGDLNSLHRSGQDLNGESGGDIFAFVGDGTKTALNLRFAFDDPHKLAAATPMITASMLDNKGSAVVAVMHSPLPATGLPLISDVLRSAAAATDAVTLLNEGAIGVIPAGASAVQLASLGRQGGMDFLSSDVDVAFGGELRFDTDGTEHRFSFPSGLTASDLANGLNVGTFLSDSGLMMKDLGVVAAGRAGQVSLSRDSGDFTAGQIDFSSGAVLSSVGGQVLPGNTNAEPVRIFTRSGTLVAGAPLSGDAAGSLLTAANGFLSDASYREALPDAPEGATGYRGMSVTRHIAQGDALSGGMARRVILEDGAAEEWTFVVDPAFDIGGLSQDGLSAISPSLSYTLSVNGTEVNFSGAQSSEEVADGLRGRLMADPNFAGLGVGVSVVAGEGLRFVSQDGSPLDIGLTVSSIAPERLYLSSLPPEDLIVVMGGDGAGAATSALRLAGSATPSAEEEAFTYGPMEFHIRDVETGRVDLFDRDTKDLITSAFLDANGEVNFWGLHFSLSGDLQSGDRFVISQNMPGSGDGRILQQMVAMAEADPRSGEGGFGKILSELMMEVGTAQQAAQQKEQTVQATHESLRRRVAEVSAVDLETEAARLIELQQAYQASAQALSVARQIFDTLLGAL